jgi:hypothetical protein
MRHHAFVLIADGHGVLRESVDEVGGAIQRINDPLMLRMIACALLAASGVAGFFGQDGMVRVGATQFINDGLFGRLIDGGRLTVDMDVTKDEKGVETGEVKLDIQPLPKKEGKAKPEPEQATAD